MLQSESPAGRQGTLQRAGVRPPDLTKHYLKKQKERYRVEFRTPQGERVSRRVPPAVFAEFVAAGYVVPKAHNRRQAVAAFGWTGEMNAEDRIVWRYRDLTSEAKVRISTAVVCRWLWLFDPKTAYRYARWWSTGEGVAPSMAEIVG